MNRWLARPTQLGIYVFLIVPFLLASYGLNGLVQY